LVPEDNEGDCVLDEEGTDSTVPTSSVQGVYPKHDMPLGHSPGEPLRHRLKHDVDASALSTPQKNVSEMSNPDSLVESLNESSEELLLAGAGDVNDESEMPAFTLLVTVGKSVPDS